MKKLVSAVVAVMCLACFSSPSFADEMGKGKGENSIGASARIGIVPYCLLRPSEWRTAR